MRISYKNLSYHREQIESLLQLADLAESCDTNIEDTFRLANQLRDSPQMQNCISRLKRDDRSRQLIDARRPYEKPDPAWLETLDRGTLGHLYYQIIKREELSLDYGPPASFFNNLELEADYVNYRIFCTHDYYHIISGFSLDIFGEIGARTLLVAQCGYPPMALTDVINLLTSWIANDICPGDDQDADGELSQIYLMEVMALGVQMAKTCMPLFGVDWNELLPYPIEKVRSDLGINPVTKGRYSWHSEHGYLLK